ncbi:MAG TPA: FHA domain-containing protein, partial [Stenomitos sp.]
MPYLIYEPETPNERIQELCLGTNTIGREQDNSIFVRDKSLSRYHAEIVIGYHQAFITDLHSRNGTFVNEIQIDHCELKDGDGIRFGSVVCQFVERLRSDRQECLGQEDSTLSIVKQVSPQLSHTLLQHLLDEDGVSGSVIRLQQQDTTQRAVDKLKILLEVSKQLSTPEEPDRLLDKILDLLLEIMKVDRAAILLVNEFTGCLEHKAIKVQPHIPPDEQFYSRRITNLVRHSGEAILITDACIDQRFSDAESILGQKIHASMCVPLRPREEVIGV